MNCDTLTTLLPVARSTLCAFRCLRQDSDSGIQSTGMLFTFLRRVLS
jgi:hypothetical protein